MNEQTNERYDELLTIAIGLKVDEVTMEVAEGDARNVLCDAVERHRASILVMGSHGYGAIKRYVIQSLLVNSIKQIPFHHLIALQSGFRKRE